MEKEGGGEGKTLCYLNEDNYYVIKLNLKKRITRVFKHICSTIFLVKL